MRKKCADRSRYGDDLLQVPDSRPNFYRNKLRGMVRISLVNCDMRRRKHRVLNFVLCCSEKRKRISDKFEQSGVFSDCKSQEKHQWGWKTL
jgi:hypothetical protein